MADDQITVGVAADISDFTAGMAQAGAAADETFGRIRTSAQSPSIYSADPTTGLLTFTAAPASDAAITADCTYWFRCLFAEDIVDFEEFMATHYRARKVAFVSLK